MVSALGPLQRRLFAFDGASVGAGDAKQLQLKLTSDALAVANERGERIVHPGVYRLVFEGPDATAAALGPIPQALHRPQPLRTLLVGDF